MSNYEDESHTDDYSATPSLYDSIRQRIRDNASVNQEQLHHFLGVRPSRRHASVRHEDYYDEYLEDEQSTFTLQSFKESASEHVQKFVGLRPKARYDIYGYRIPTSGAASVSSKSYLSTSSRKSTKSSSSRKSTSKKLVVIQEEDNTRRRYGKLLQSPLACMTCVVKSPKEYREDVEESRDDTTEERDEYPSSRRNESKRVAFLGDQIGEEEEVEGEEVHYKEVPEEEEADVREETEEEEKEEEEKEEEEADEPQFPVKITAQTREDRNWDEIQESVKRIKKRLGENKKGEPEPESSSIVESKSNANSIVDGEGVNDTPGNELEVSRPIGMWNNSLARNPIMACLNFEDDWSDDESFHYLFSHSGTNDSEGDDTRAHGSETDDTGTCDSEADDTHSHDSETDDTRAHNSEADDAFSM